MTTKETASAHTPLPFGVFVSPEDKLYLAQVSANGAMIKHVCIFTLDDNRAENAANAEFMVRACNNHEDMIAALEIAANVIKTRLMYETPGSAEYQDQSRVLETIHNTLGNANAR